MSKKVVVIDGNSLMHRAYHAVQTPMNAPDGTPTNAVFGFLSMFLKFIEMSQPDAVVCAFDAGKPQFRIAELESYKAQRVPMDDELRVQFPVIEELLNALNVPVIKVEGWEGDDILGTIAVRDEGLGYETLLVTGDKDACQLASDSTSIVTTKRGMTDITVSGPAEVVERYGVTPEQFPDFLGLMGDSSDNIPGVPGIGPKNAAKLLQRFSSLQGIYDHIDELSGKQMENLRDNEDTAFLSRRIATIVTDLDFPLDLEEISFPSFEAQDVEKAFGHYALNSALARVLRLIDAPSSQKTASFDLDEPITGDAARIFMDDVLKKDERIGVAFVDASQTSLFAEGATAAFSTAAGTAVFEGTEALEMFALVLVRGRFATLDTKSALHRVYPNDTSKEPYVDDEDIRAMDVFDAGLAAYALNSSKSPYTYESLTETYLGCAFPETKNDSEYAVACARIARELPQCLSDALKKDNVFDVYHNIDLPLVAVLAFMERTGAAIDCEKLDELGKSTEFELNQLASEIYDLAGEEFNIDSPKQLSHILFDVIGLKPLKKTQRGYSTDAGVLKELSKVHELPSKVLRYRELAKIKSTYIDALPRMCAGDGRVHTQFNETVTTTGRLSSSDPNLQNIPVRTEFGRKIRECFVPLCDGSLFMSADYSQIELRLLAHLSGDEHLRAAFNSGVDFHSATAARVFGIPIEDVTPELRSRAKAVNFGIVYGQQAFGLAQSLDIPFDEAKDIIDRYYEAYPGVRTYLDDTVAKAKECGYATTMFGRKRHITELKAKNVQQRNFGERTAMNHPMQGSAADIIKLAMSEVDHRLHDEGFEARLMLQVHDELDFSVPESEVERLSDMVREVMSGVVQLSVPLVVDVSWGATWADAH